MFIDVTGISQAAVTKSLDTLVCSLGEIGGTIETVDDRRRRRQEAHDARLEAAHRRKSTSPKPKRWLGLPLDDKSLAESLRKMRFDVCSQRSDTAQLAGSRFPTPPTAPTSATWSTCSKTSPSATATRNIEPRLVRSMTVGTPRPEEMLSDRVRQILIGLGYSEIMSLPLTTEEHQFERLRMPTPERYPEVANPKLKAYNVVRTHLMGGLFEALRENRRRPMPQRLFEIDNVVALDDSAETGAAE